MEEKTKERESACYYFSVTLSSLTEPQESQRDPLTPLHETRTVPYNKDRI